MRVELSGDGVRSSVQNAPAARHRGARLVAALGLLVALALVLAPRQARAHVALRSSTPADGASVTAPVDAVHLRFSRPVEPRRTRATVAGPAQRLALGPASVVPDTGDREVALDLPALEPGAYVLAWRAMSRDGHPVAGRFSFTIEPSLDAPPAAGSGASAEAPPRVRGAAPSTSAGGSPRTAGEPPLDEPLSIDAPLAVAVRLVHLAGLVGAIGVVAFQLLVLPRARRRLPHAGGGAAMARRGWGVGLVATGVLTAGIAGRLLVQGALLHGGDPAWSPAPYADVLTSSWGAVWLAELVGAVAFAGAALRARATGRAPRALSLAAAIVLALVAPLSGHATSVERLPALAVVAATLHVAGASAWLGTLLVVLLAGFRGRADGGPSPAQLVVAFSPVALAAAGLTVATGLVNARFQLAAVSDLWSTRYGVTLLIKVGAVALVAIAGLHNWRRVLPRVAAGASPRVLLPSATVELLLAGAVLLVTAVLIASPTP